MIAVVAAKGRMEVLSKSEVDVCAILCRSICQPEHCARPVAGTDDERAADA